MKAVAFQRHRAAVDAERDEIEDAAPRSLVDPHVGIVPGLSPRSRRRRRHHRPMARAAAVWCHVHSPVAAHPRRTTSGGDMTTNARMTLAVLMVGAGMVVGHASTRFDRAAGAPTPVVSAA